MCSVFCIRFVSIIWGDILYAPQTLGVSELGLTTTKWGMPCPIFFCVGMNLHPFSYLPGFSRLLTVADFWKVWEVTLRRQGLLSSRPHTPLSIIPLSRLPPLLHTGPPRPYRLPTFRHLDPPLPRSVPRPSLPRTEPTSFTSTLHLPNSVPLPLEWCFSLCYPP